MPIHVASSPPERELPDFVRRGAHKKLDEILAMYEGGYPLWLRSTFAWSAPCGGAEIHLTIKDWV